MVMPKHFVVGNSMTETLSLIFAGGSCLSLTQVPSS
jgi:hypothetical protein